MNKKFFSLFLITTFLQFNLTAYAAPLIEDDVTRQTFKGQNITKLVFKQEIIKDEIDVSNFNKKQQVKANVNIPIIEDEAIEVLKNKKNEKPVFKQEIIKDTTPVLNVKNEQFTKPQKDVALIEDKIIVQELKTKTLREQNLTKPVFNYNSIDFDTNTINIPVSSTCLISVKKQHLDEGMKVKFQVVEDVKINNLLFVKKDTPVEGIIETITKSSGGGDPEEIIIGRFVTNDVNGNKIDLAGQIQKKGANRALWIRPLVWLGCASFFGTPLVVLLLVKGGPVKIKPEQKYALYYE